ncbi:hypothetical protein ABWH91_14140 [Phycisphaerales bacterium ac7]
MTFRSTVCALALIVGSAVSGCASSDSRFGIHAGSTESGEPYTVVYLRPEPVSPNPVYYNPEPFLTGADVDSFSDTRDAQGNPALGFRLKDDAAEAMRALTRDRVGQPIVMTLDGEVIFAPIVNSAIGRNGIVTGDGETDWLNELKRALEEAGAAETGGPATR